MSDIFALKPLKYLSKMYLGDFLDFVNGVFFKVRFLPDNVFLDEDNIVKYYSVLNEIYKEYESLCIVEVADMAFKMNGVDYNIILPMEILIFSCDDKTFKLKPDICDITLDIVENQAIITINLNFLNCLNIIEKVQKNIVGKVKKNIFGLSCT